MEELFFAVTPIWWEGNGLSYQIILIGILCLLIVIIFFLKKYHNSHKSKEVVSPEIPNFTPIGTNDHEFEMKTLSELKKIIGFFYRPEHSTAHTVHEIGKYLFDSSLIEIGQKLETSIYTGKKLSKESRSEISSTILNFLEDSKKKLH